MTKLSDTQCIILSAASQRFDGNLLPLPGSLRGGAAKKVVGALLARGLIAERPGQDHHEPDAALNTVWRNEDDGRAVRLFITETGLAAIGCDPEDGAVVPDTATEAVAEALDAGAAAEGATPEEGVPAGDLMANAAGVKDHKVRTGTKQAMLIEMLRAARGRHHRRDRRRHRMAAAHRPRRHRRGAEEEARARSHLRECRGARPGL